MSDKNMTHHIAHYRNVFIYLLIGTALTVSASYLEFSVQNSIAGAIFVGLTIAIIKGYLVAANFMHLNNEKNLIYMILSMTVVFFLVLFSMPTLWHNDGLHSPDDIPKQNGEIYKEVDHNNHDGDH